MLISVIIPVYNTKDYLEKCVNSILDSDVTDCEIILVDDGSTDNQSGQLCDVLAEKNPDTVRVIHQANKGLGGARNTGIDEAKGEYLLFIDSDDAVTPKALDVLKGYISKQKADIYSFNLVTDDGNGEGALVKSNSFESDKAFSLAEHPEYIMSIPSACCRLWRRSLFAETGIRFPDKVWYEDIRTTSKIFVLANSILTIDECLYIYYQREGSIMRTTNVARNREIIDALDDVIHWYKENGHFEKFREYICALCIENVYLAASVRVLKADPKHPLLKEFREYTREQFPEYKSSSYLKKIAPARKLAFRLLELKMYRLLAILFRVHG